MEESNNQNPFLQEFFDNSKKMRNELMNNSDLFQKIEDRLNIKKNHCGFRSEESWYNNVFIPLIPGKLGLKRRDLDIAHAEIAIHADLYSPKLPISPFVVKYSETADELIYIVKDFGFEDNNRSKLRECVPAMNAIEYMIKKGYGTGSNIRVNKIDSEIIKYSKQHPDNIWFNIFAYDGKNNWAMVDLDGNWTLMDNSEEIYEGIYSGEGRFGRLKQMVKEMSKPEYSLK